MVLNPPKKDSYPSKKGFLSLQKRVIIPPKRVIIQKKWFLSLQKEL